MHPTLLMALVLTLGFALAAVFVVLGAICIRLRALPFAESARILDDISRRQREIENIVISIETKLAASLSATESAEVRPSGGTSTKTMRRVDHAESNAVAGPTLIAIPNMSANSPTGPASATAELGRKFGAIWELADAGAPSEAIARTTGQPIGQVELILGLRRQIAGAGASSNTGVRT